MTSSGLTYEEWLALSDQERQNIVRSWNPYEGDGQELLKVACERFRHAFEKEAGIEDVHCGVYHGGVLVIGVTVKRGSRIRLPKAFEGFPVMRFVK